MTHSHLSLSDISVEESLKNPFNTGLNRKLASKQLELRYLLSVAVWTLRRDEEDDMQHPTLELSTCAPSLKLSLHKYNPWWNTTSAITDALVQQCNLCLSSPREICYKCNTWLVLTGGFSDYSSVMRNNELYNNCLSEHAAHTVHNSAYYMYMK